MNLTRTLRQLEAEREPEVLLHLLRPYRQVGNGLKYQTLFHQLTPRLVHFLVHHVDISELDWLLGQVVQAAPCDHLLILASALAGRPLKHGHYLFSYSLLHPDKRVVHLTQFIYQNNSIHLGRLTQWSSDYSKVAIWDQLRQDPTIIWFYLVRDIQGLIRAYLENFFLYLVEEN